MLHSQTDRPLFFWQNTVSIHQAPLIKSLSEQLAQDVHVIAATDIPQDRLDLGWEQPDYGDASVVISDSASEWKTLCKTSPARGVHVVSGLGSYPLVARLSRHLILHRRATYALTEPWDPRNDTGARKIARRLRFASVGPWAMQGIFTTGSLAVKQMRHMGIDADKLHPWGYFPEYNAPRTVNSTEYDFVFVGSLTSRKDVDSLLRAAAAVKGVSVAIVGDGPLRSSLEQLATSLQKSVHVDFFGSLPAGDRDDLLARSKVLVLPSLFDGWGAVVNEALLAGCTVLVSDASGSACLAANGLPVYDFPAGDVAHLARLMKRVSSAAIDRSKTATAAAEQISPLSAATYFLRCLESSGGPGITAPWMRVPL